MDARGKKNQGNFAVCRIGRHQSFDYKLRWIKSPYEIEQLKTAGKIGAEGVLEAIKITKSGIFEYELEAVATYYYVKRGARGDAFQPIVASGP